MKQCSWLRRVVALLALPSAAFAQNSLANIKLNTTSTDPLLSGSEVLPVAQKGIWRNFPGSLLPGMIGMTDQTFASANVGRSLATGADGPVGRTASSYIGDAPNVRDFGAKCDGAADDTAAFNRAFASGALFLAVPGTCNVSTLHPPPPNLHLTGYGRYVSTIRTTSATGDVLPLTNSGVVIDHLGFNSTVTRTSGAYVHFQASNLTLTDFLTIGAYGAVWIDDRTAITSIDGGYIFNSVGSGQGVLRYGSGTATGPLAAYLGHTVIDSSTPNYNALEVVNLSDLTIEYLQALSATNNLLVDPGNEQNVFSLTVANSYFDQGGTMVSFKPTGTGKIGRIKFTSDWFGSGTTNNVLLDGGSGSALIDGVSFWNCESLLSAAGSGLAIQNNTKNISWSGGRITDNAVGVFDSRNSSYDGLTIHGALIGAGGGLPGSGIGVSAGGSGDYLSLIGNDMRGNISAAFASTNVGTHNRVQENLGLNPIGSVSVALGPSPWTYPASAYGETAFVKGGRISSIAINGMRRFSAAGSPLVIPLEPNDVMVITYTVAPTMMVYRH